MWLISLQKPSSVVVGQLELQRIRQGYIVLCRGNKLHLVEKDQNPEADERNLGPESVSGIVGRSTAG